jgi:hypothetical protein
MAPKLGIWIEPTPRNARAEDAAARHARDPGGVHVQLAAHAHGLVPDDAVDPGRQQEAEHDHRPPEVALRERHEQDQQQQAGEGLQDRGAPLDRRAEPGEVPADQAEQRAEGQGDARADQAGHHRGVDGVQQPGEDVAPGRVRPQRVPGRADRQVERVEARLVGPVLRQDVREQSQDHERQDDHAGDHRLRVADQPLERVAPHLGRGVDVRCRRGLDVDRHQNILAFGLSQPLATSIRRFTPIVSATLNAVSPMRTGKSPCIATLKL